MSLIIRIFLALAPLVLMSIDAQALRAFPLKVVSEEVTPDCLQIHAYAHREPTLQLKNNCSDTIILNSIRTAPSNSSLEQAPPIKVHVNNIGKGEYSFKNYIFAETDESCALAKNMWEQEIDEQKKNYTELQRKWERELSEDWLDNILIKLGLKKVVVKSNFVELACKKLSVPADGVLEIKVYRKSRFSITGYTEDGSASQAKSSVLAKGEVFDSEIVDSVDAKDSK